MDLMGSVQIQSIEGKKCIFVCVDDFSWYTWVDFVREKSDTFRKLCVKLANEKDCNVGQIVRIRSDHGKEFKNIFALIFAINMALHMNFRLLKH